MIKCAELRCKYRTDRGNCKCKKVLLSSWNVSTLNIGQKNFLECKSFEYDEKYLELKKKFEKLTKIKIEE